MIDVRVTGVKDFAELGARWRDLEQRSDGSFFQSWTWVGCLATERFPDPILVEATEDGRIVSMALFNRVRRWVGPAVLHLGESGTAELDCPYVEQNGPLIETGREHELTLLTLRAVASRYDLVLPGITQLIHEALRQATGLVRVIQSKTSPFVDLAALRAAQQNHLDHRSANTRQQIRRSDRLYERQGPIEVQCADSVKSANTMLDEMATLHQAAWRARGQPGSFARPLFRRFHRDLIATALPRGEVVLLKVSCSSTVIGILLNFVHRGTMLAYQSGFAYTPAEPRFKPGLTCHHRAIRYALDQGLDKYDLLAGRDRYKSSLAESSYQQMWVEAGPAWSPRLLLRLATDVVKQSAQQRKRQSSSKVAAT